MKEWIKLAALTVFIVLIGPASILQAQGDQPGVELIELRHRRSVEVADIVSRLYLNEPVQLEVDETANRLVVVGEAEAMMRVKDLVAMLDVAAEEALENEQIVRVYALQYARAEDAAAVVNELLGSHPNSIVRMSFDPRINTVIATGSEDDLLVIGDLLERIDRDPAANEEAASGDKSYLVRVTWLSDIGEKPGFEDDVRSLRQELVPLGNALRTSGELKVVDAVTDLQTAVSVANDGRAANAFGNTSTRYLGGVEVSLSANGSVRALSDGQLHIEIDLTMTSPDASALIDTAVTMPLDHPVALSVSDVGTFKSVAVIEITEMK